MTEPEQHPVLWLCHIQRRTWALWQDDARCWHAHGKKEKMELALHYKREQCPPNEASASPSWSLVLFSSRVNSSRCLLLLLLLLILLLLAPPSSCCHNTYIVGMEEEEEEQLPKAVAERSPVQQAWVRAAYHHQQTTAASVWCWWVWLTDKHSRNAPTKAQPGQQQLFFLSWELANFALFFPSSHSLRMTFAVAEKVWVSMRISDGPTTAPNPLLNV